MIHVYKNYYLSADENCFTLVKSYKGTEKSENGETREIDKYKAIGYYTTFEAAIRGLINRNDLDVAGELQCDLLEALKEIKASRAEIVKVAKEIEEDERN